MEHKAANREKPSERAGKSLFGIFSLFNIPEPCTLGAFVINDNTGENITRKKKKLFCNSFYQWVRLVQSNT